jgi:hypothetical protein
MSEVERTRSKIPAQSYGRYIRIVVKQGIRALAVAYGLSEIDEKVMLHHIRNQQIRVHDGIVGSLPDFIVEVLNTGVVTLVDVATIVSPVGTTRQQ